MARTASKSLFTPDLLLPAVGDSFRKLNPKELIRNPVMFTTACVAALLTIFIVAIADWFITGQPLSPAAVLGGSMIIVAFGALSWSTYREMMEHEMEKRRVDLTDSDEDGDLSSHED